MFGFGLDNVLLLCALLTALSVAIIAIWGKF